LRMQRHGRQPSRERACIITAVSGPASSQRRERARPRIRHQHHCWVRANKTRRVQPFVTRGDISPCRHASARLSATGAATGHPSCRQPDISRVAHRSSRPRKEHKGNTRPESRRLVWPASRISVGRLPDGCGIKAGRFLSQTKASLWMLCEVTGGLGENVPKRAHRRRANGCRALDGRHCRPW